MKDLLFSMLHHGLQARRVLRQLRACAAKTRVSASPQARKQTYAHFYTACCCTGLAQAERPRAVALCRRKPCRHAPNAQPAVSCMQRYARSPVIAEPEMAFQKACKLLDKQWLSRQAQKREPKRCDRSGSRTLTGPYYWPGGGCGGSVILRRQAPTPHRGGCKVARVAAARWCMRSRRSGCEIARETSPSVPQAAVQGLHEGIGAPGTQPGHVAGPAEAEQCGPGCPGPQSNPTALPRRVGV